MYRSPADFFPADLPRPVAPDLLLRTVTLPSPVLADHLRMVVRTNACTGAPGFDGADKNAVAEALAPTDCTVTVNAQRVTITELQAFGTAASAVAAPRAAAGSAGSGGAGSGSAGAGGSGSGARPVSSAGTLPTTGAPVALAVVAFGLLGAAGFAARRRG